MVNKVAHLVGVIEEARGIPARARNPPVRETIPFGGCRKVFDPAKRTWGFMSGGGDTVEKACMFHRVVLR